MPRKIPYEKIQELVKKHSWRAELETMGAKNQKPKRKSRFDFLDIKGSLELLKKPRSLKRIGNEMFVINLEFVFSKNKMSFTKKIDGEIHCFRKVHAKNFPDSWSSSLVKRSKMSPNPKYVEKRIFQRVAKYNWVDITEKFIKA